MQTPWRKFDYQSLTNALQGRDLKETLVVILRSNGKAYVGKIDSVHDVGPDGVTLTNFMVGSKVIYDLGPPKRFTLLDASPPNVAVGERQLPLT